MKKSEHIVSWVLQMLWLTLRRRYVQAKWFRMEVMGNGRGKSPGWLAMSAAKYAAVRHLRHLSVIFGTCSSIFVLLRAAELHDL